MNPKGDVGTPIVVSAPSGAGKTTLCLEVIRRMPNVAFSISYTTRPPRGDEQDGKAYHFVSEAQFDALVQNGQLLEWAHVHGHRYGTGLEATKACLASGRDLLFDIDVQGGEAIAKGLPGGVQILVLPPSMAVLAQRLADRGNTEAADMKRRLAVATEEIYRAGQSYSHVVINDDLERSVTTMMGIVHAARAARVLRDPAWLKSFLSAWDPATL